MIGPFARLPHMIIIIIMMMSKQSGNVDNDNGNEQQ
jgi:hypothetical protein